MFIDKCYLEKANLFAARATPERSRLFQSAVKVELLLTFAPELQLCKAEKLELLICFHGAMSAIAAVYRCDIASWKLSNKVEKLRFNFSGWYLRKFLFNW